jgi:AraC-like DNA-binding protein/quercetin dioxygenase-like cupin family protein
MANMTKSKKQIAQSATDPDRARRALFVLSEKLSSGSGIAHRHRMHQLLYASEGLFTVYTEHGIWVVPPHRAVWLPAGQMHRVASRTNFDLCSLYASPRLKRNWVAGTSVCRVIAVSPLLRELLLAASGAGDQYTPRGPVRRMLEVALDQIEAMNIIPLALPLLRDVRAARVAERLRADPRDSRTLKQWGSTVGASSRSLERLFQRDTQMSFSRWRIQLRLMTSLELLGENRPVTEVAFAVGYEDTSAFIAAFKRYFGITPRRYFSNKDRQPAALNHEKPPVIHW